MFKSLVFYNEEISFGIEEKLLEFVKKNPFFDRVYLCFPKIFQESRGETKNFSNQSQILFFENTFISPHFRKEFFSQITYGEDDLFLLTASDFFLSLRDVEKIFTQQQEEDWDSFYSGSRLKGVFRDKKGDFLKGPLYQEDGTFYGGKASFLKDNSVFSSGKVGCYAMRQSDLMGSLKDIKIFLTDVDGVLTDGGMYYSKDGDSMKKFNTRDGMALLMMRQKGIKVGIVTSETTDIVKRRAEKLKLDYLFMGRDFNNKVEILERLCQEEKVSPLEVCYIGDDVNDLEILKAVGFKFCPSDAQRKVQAIPGINILEKKGGDGVIREIFEKLNRENLFEGN